MIAITPLLSSVYHKAYTFTTDTAIRIEIDPSLWLSSCNLACYTNDAYYGSAAGTEAIIRANAVVWFDAPVRPYDFVFKNLNAGSNAKIVITGTVKQG